MTLLVTSPDAGTAATWAASRGYALTVTESDDGVRTVFANDADAERHDWAYFGSGSLVEAVHEAMTYPVRDRGFDGAFVENCGVDYCPFCTDRPFPTDEGRS